MKICIINGVNLKYLDKRESIYGGVSLQQIQQDLVQQFGHLAQLEFFDSDIEGEIVRAIWQADCPIIINAGAYSHYSLAIADALRACKHKKIEVHLSNVFAREEQRHTLVTAAACDGLICGLGARGYALAITEILQ